VYKDVRTKDMTQKEHLIHHCPVTFFVMHNNKTHKLPLKCEIKHNLHKNWTKI